MKPVSKIFLDISKSVGASGVQLLITLVATPIMTRLYAPETYAAFGIINTLATTVVGIGLLSLPNAYPLEKDPYRAQELLQTMRRLLMLLVVMATLAAIAMGITHRADYGIAALALFPVLVFTFGIRQMAMAVATAHANFHRISIGQIIEPACSRIGSIGLGAAIGSHPAFILGSVAIGNVAAAMTIGKTSLRETLRVFFSAITQRISIRPSLRRYSDFVVYNTASLQAQALVMLAVQMGFAAIFSPHDAGQYILAVSILTLPATIVALATSRVVYRHFIEIEQTNPAQLSRHVAVAMLLYFIAGITILSPIYFFGETIFTIAFSEVWSQAGTVASSLSMAYVGMFVFNGVQSIFRVTRRLKLQFFLEIITCGIMLIVIITGFRHLTFPDAIHILSTLWIARNVVMLAAFLTVAHQHANHRSARQ
jgi:O-antigen/teichoic acid export membrane protein